MKNTNSFPFQITIQFRPVADGLFEVNAASSLPIPRYDLLALVNEYLRQSFESKLSFIRLSRDHNSWFILLSDTLLESLSVDEAALAQSFDVIAELSDGLLHELRVTLNSFKPGDARHDCYVVDTRILNYTGSVEVTDLSVCDDQE